MKDGYYWVRFAHDKDYYIAFYNSTTNRYYITGCDDAMCSSDFDYIDNRSIERERLNIV